MGGDKVLEFTYEDGTTPDVPAGAGILLAAGVAVRAYETAGHLFEAQVTAGLKYRTIPPATNQEATWLRFPVEAMAFYRAPVNVRFGIGPTVHLANTLSASGAVLNDKVTFKTAPGVIFQAEYVRSNLSFDARYTALKYEATGGASGSVDASSLGLGISYFFGQPRASGTR